MRSHSQTVCQSLVAMLVLMSHLATEIAVGDQHGIAWLIILKCVLIAVPVGVLTVYSWRRNWQPGSLTTLLAITGMTGVMLVEPVWRGLFGVGHPLEIQLLIGLRNVSLVCLIWSRTQKFESLAGLTSLFSLLFCVSASQDPSLIWISSLYLLVGVAWLALRYWNSLQTQAIRDQRWRSPRLSIAVLAILLCIGLLTVATPTQTRMRIVQGLLPSSGGTGQADPFARSGVGDGDALVAATREARSFAPIEEAPFLEGKQPSLYDMYQDTYGPPKKITKTDRAISLPPELFTQNHKRMAQAKKASRSFSLDRNRPQGKQRKSLKDTSSNAILHLVGPVPAHLRHTTYDLFDGLEWFPEQVHENNTRPLDVETIDEKPWIRWTSHAGSIDRGMHVAHALRILAIDTNRVVAPANLNGIHIDHCDRPDMFLWAQPDVLAIDRDSLPGMTVIHVVSELANTNELDSEQVGLKFGMQRYRSLPVGPGMDAVLDLARQWTADADSDWAKVCAIRDRLQTEYVHDPEAVVPQDCGNPLAWFLLESRRGPDYLFATAAVTLCRAVGISARGVSGFYADPEKFDFSTQQTSVYPSDTHWWAEVYLGRQQWTTVEATPGYRQREVPATWMATISAWIVDGSKQAIVYWPLTVIATLCLGLAFWQRQRISMELRLGLWRLWFWSAPRSAEQWRRLLISAGKLWDRRLRLAGQPRPAFRTPAQMLKQNGVVNGSQVDIDQLARALDWALYSTDAEAPTTWHTQRLHQDCLTLLARAESRRKSIAETEPVRHGGAV